MGSGLDAVPHVFIVSHERSGTHVAIDAVRNNFPIYKRRFYTSIDRMVDVDRRHRSPETIEALLEEGPSVIKTHMTQDTDFFFRSDDGAASKLLKSVW